MVFQKNPKLEMYVVKLINESLNNFGHFLIYHKFLVTLILGIYQEKICFLNFNHKDKKIAINIAYMTCLCKFQYFQKNPSESICCHTKIFDYTRSQEA